MEVVLASTNNGSLRSRLVSTNDDYREGSREDCVTRWSIANPSESNLEGNDESLGRLTKGS